MDPDPVTPEPARKAIAAHPVRVRRGVSAGADGGPDMFVVYLESIDGEQLAPLAFSDCEVRKLGNLVNNYLNHPRHSPLQN